MFDPAAIATANVGLEHIRREQDGYDHVRTKTHRREPDRPPRRTQLAHRLAVALRRMADGIDPAPQEAYCGSAPQ